MNFQLKSPGIAGLEQIEDKIHAKIKRFDRLVPETAFMELILKQSPKAKTKGDKEAEIILDIPGRKGVIRFVERGTMFLEAIDLVLDKVDGELSKEKSKLIDRSERREKPIKERVAEMVNQEEM